MKTSIILTCLGLILAGNPFASVLANTVQNPLNASANLVNGLLMAGYRQSPPTPAGVSLGADEIECYQTDFGPAGRSVSCTVKGAGAKNPLNIIGEEAELILQSLRELGAQGVLINPETLEFMVKTLRCYYDALPKPNQPYHPSWHCEFQR
jgi:hypothetical protein